MMFADISPAERGQHGWRGGRQIQPTGNGFCVKPYTRQKTDCGGGETRAKLSRDGGMSPDANSITPIKANG